MSLFNGIRDAESAWFNPGFLKMQPEIGLNHGQYAHFWHFVRRFSQGRTDASRFVRETDVPGRTTPNRIRSHFCGDKIVLDTCLRTDACSPFPSR